MAVDYAANWASRAVREGLSARAGLRAFRAGGGSIRDATWFRTFAEVKRTVAARGDEIGRPLNRRPTGDEMTRWTTPGPSRVGQQVEIMYRVAGEDEILTTYFTVTSRNGITRGRAVDQAIEWFDQGVDAGSPPGEQQVLLGAVHVGAYRMGA